MPENLDELNVKTQKPQMVGISSFEGGMVHERFLQAQIKQRADILRYLSSSDVNQVANHLGLKSIGFKIDEATDWCIVAQPLYRFDIYYLMQRYSPEFDDSLRVLYAQSALELRMPAEDVTHLTLVYANSLIYAAKILGKKIPKLSEYL